MSNPGYQPQGYAQPPYPYTPPPDTTGPTLVLVGAIIGCVFLGIGVIYFALMSFLFAAVRTQTPVPSFFGGILLVFALVLLGLTIPGLILAFTGRKLMQTGYPRRGSIRAIIGGSLLILPSMIAGILILIGGVIQLGKLPKDSP